MFKEGGGVFGPSDFGAPAGSERPAERRSEP